MQSPFVYDFIWQVIDNRSAYYAYTDLYRELKALPLRQRKLAKLLFRLANYVQPSIIRLDKDLHNTYAPFLERGCAKVAITTTDDTVPTMSSQSSFRAYLNARAGSKTFSIVINNELTGIASADAVNGKAEPVDVCTVDGKLIRKQVDAMTALQGLPKGIYIVNGKKIRK